MINLFALIQGEALEIKRIPLDANVQATVSEMFINQSVSLLEDKELVDYQGGYKADSEEIFRIENFHVPAVITNGVQNPLGLDVFDINEYEGKVIAIVASSDDANNPFIGFQYFDSRKILNRKFSLWLSNDTYNRIAEHGLTIGSKLDLLINGTTIYFNSFTLANRMLDLSNYMQEATEEDIDTFVGDETFEFADPVGFRDDLSPTMKKKLRIIVQSGITEEIGVQAILGKAQELELPIELNEAGDRLAIPRDKNLVKDLIRVLNEDYFFSILRGTKYLTNSKRTTN